MKRYFQNKTILVTGGTGSIGSEIVRQLIKFEPASIRIFSRDEYKQYEMKNDLSRYNNIRFLIGNVRDKSRLMMAMEDVDIVYHAAAIKHVPISEYNPFEAIKTNILGTQNAIESALESGVKLFVGISTDKAAEPGNVMGATKLLEEKLITSATFYKGKKLTKFSSVRFGNVIGSRGSVIPRLISQIKVGGPVTVTDPEMTRFFMTIPDAVGLIFKATENTKGGEVFIFKMPVMKIGDLAEALIKYFAPRFNRNPEDIQIERIKPRPGEKRYEVLLTETESEYALQTEDMFIILPHPQYQIALDFEKYKYPDFKKVSISKYDSTQPSLTVDDILNIIKKIYP